jgi:hypothetical protein
VRDTLKEDDMGFLGGLGKALGGAAGAIGGAMGGGAAPAAPGAGAPPAPAGGPSAAPGMGAIKNMGMAPGLGAPGAGIVPGGLFGKKGFLGKKLGLGAPGTPLGSREPRPTAAAPPISAKLQTLAQQTLAQGGPGLATPKRDMLGGPTMTRSLGWGEMARRIAGGRTMRGRRR